MRLLVVGTLIRFTPALSQLKWGSKILIIILLNIHNQCTVCTLKIVFLIFIFSSGVHYIEGRRTCFNKRHTQHILFTVIWRQTYGKGPLR